ncbi:MAG: alpha/beta hydrolase [Okeania sp. SIO2G4]|uniref:alpha/beta fold hydrolase n=1 Tax=unclassified Okeania TaxID=2634635 RepID=UPI0013BD2FE1|nr:MULTISPECIES: alpha/beta hydrolase [unclassified Okeania]NEP04471.1 alpha/beta hydrolase [Okeania sp. SIO4D6]NEP39585.1 alpha/beta hydrolase [Okeania sp. SIO2H7]NEP74862.1 alpha/beta hydrolase [Okeania sp. SIO2G5]NEP96773.1 alpha/beta hydrolase [Okeania sp. SIO2F5]NEQ93698.1 alpha/beta hydrolase [Okeania sp. SIO2G4]
MQVATSQISFLRPTTPRPELPLLIFLPAMDGTGKLLRSQQSRLSNAFDIRCLSIPPNDLSSWDRLLEKTVELIEIERQAIPERPVYLCGESFGGCLALKVAFTAPELFNKLILVNSASSFSQQPLVKYGSYLTQYLPSYLYRLSVTGTLPFLAALGRIERAERQALLEAMQSVSQQTSIWRLELMRSFQVDKNQLKKLKKPVLVIASAADRLLPSISQAKFLVKHLPEAKMVVLPNSGHACLLETDVDFYTIIRDRWGCELVRAQTDIVSTTLKITTT